MPNPFAEFFRKRIAYETYTQDQKHVISILNKKVDHIPQANNVAPMPDLGEGKYGADLVQHNEYNSSSSMQSVDSTGSHEIETEKGNELEGIEIIYIKFEENDPEDPFHWSPLRKNVAMFVILLISLIGGITGASLSSGVSSMQKELNTSHELAVLGFSISVLGFALGPLPLSPIGEEYGRYVCYSIGILSMTIFAIPVAVAKSIKTVICFRLLLGLLGSVSSSMTGGSIADIYHPSQRGIPMLLHTIVNFVANVISPVSFTYLAWLRSFRWIEYIMILVTGFSFILMLLFMQETRGNVILQSRANRMQKLDGGPNKVYLVAGKEYISMRRLMQRTIFRPLTFFAKEPVITWFSLWMGFVWGMIYICFGAVPLVLQGSYYKMNPGQASLVFIAELIGIIIAIPLELYQQHLYEKYKHKWGPEARLFTSCAGGFFVFAGLMIFGFSQTEGSWVGPAAGLACLLIGVFSIFQAITLYFADLYDQYCSSALAVQSLTRNLCGFAFPLFTYQMFTGMTVRWASFLAAMISLALAFVPLIFLFKGPVIRAHSHYIAKNTM